jgi:hypothetical protein
MNQPDTRSQRELVRELSKRTYLLDEFIVEFLGSLVPGILFAVSLILIFVPSFCAFFSVLGKEPTPYSLTSILVKFLYSAKETPYMIWFGIIMIGLILSYLFGHLFYRCDPKVPNQKSFSRITKERKPFKKWLTELLIRIKEGNTGDQKKEEDEKDKRKQWLRENFACESEEDCEFPFSYMHKYLELRGHTHLLPLVKWTKNRDHRSKTIINLFKIRLQYYFPEQYRRILRNEAHVRLSTSAWYMAGASVKFASIGIAICFISAVLYFLKFLYYNSSSGNSIIFFDLLDFLSHALFLPLVVYFFSLYLIFKLEKFIHYQRIREVFYVLELTYTSLNDYPKLLYLNQLDENSVFGDFHPGSNGPGAKSRINADMG